MSLLNKVEKTNISEVPFVIFCKRVFFIFLFFTFILYGYNAFAQYNVSGQNNPSIKYRQINTNRFQIVYPDYYEQNAQLLAAILDTLTQILGNSLNTQVPKVPILIHTKSSISNGLSTWAPKRMEFWTTPPPTTYAYPYMWQLAIHEYRHSAQMQAMNIGTTKVAGRIFGEHILGAVAGIGVPNWFFEGDAIVAETALAPTGRGQEPEYNMYLKSQILDKGRYTLDKMLLGSMKDFIPDRYNLGYFLVSYGRAAYGKNIWGDCLNNIGRNWFNLTAFGKTSKGNLNFKNMYNSAIDSLEKFWANSDIEYMKNYASLPLKKWGEKYPENYVNYKNPIQINDSTVLALKSSAYKVQTLVKITNNNEDVIIRVPYLLHSYFDYNDGKILYAQYSPNIRWGQESCADIVEYNIQTNTLKTITSNSTYFTPSYNKNDNLIAAIITDSIDNQYVNILYSNAKARKNRNIVEKDKSNILYSMGDGKNAVYSYPVWKNNNEIFVIQTSSFGKAIVKYNIQTAQKEIVLPYSYNNIKNLKIYNDRLYFVGDIKNKFQLVSINTNDYSDIKIHTNSRYGIENYCLYDSTIVLSDYSADGYKIISVPYSQKPVDLNTSNADMYFTKINRESENFILNYNTIDTTKHYKSDKYLRFTHLFNFHSWAPVFINAAAKELGIGASILSQNLLSSSVLALGFKYNFHDKNELYMKYTYSGFYPIINITSSYKPRDLRKDLDSNKIKYLNWDEINVGLDITLPLSWTNRNFFNSIYTTLYYNIHKIINEKGRVRITLFNSLGYELKISNYTAMAPNDLYPRYGHITDFKFSHTLTSKYSEIYSYSSQIFLPGMTKNHSLAFTLSFQKNTPNVYYFPNEVNFVRGVYYIYPKYFFGGLATYNFPLAYPDSGVSGIFYIKRIVAKPFYNIGSYDKVFYQSYGIDIESKMHVFRITIPIDLGFRLGYCPKTKSNFASILFNIDI